MRHQTFSLAFFSKTNNRRGMILSSVFIYLGRGFSVWRVYAGYAGHTAFLISTLEKTLNKPLIFIKEHFC